MGCRLGELNYKLGEKIGYIKLSAHSGSAILILDMPVVIACLIDEILSICRYWIQPFRDGGNAMIKAAISRSEPNHRS